MAIALEILDLHFRHEHRGEWVLHGTTLKAEAGQITTILGPNGAGKTTLFKCILGLWHPQRGSITCRGFNLVKMSPLHRARLCAFVPQDHVPPFPYSVGDMVLLGRTPYVSMFSVPGREDRRRAEEAMKKTGIYHLRHRPYTNLSGGERQMVLLTRALVQETPILLLDEPTAHLDYRHQVDILNCVRELVKERNLTVLMTMHDPNLTLQFSHRVALMKEGEIIIHGQPEEVMTEGNLSFLYGLPLKVYQVGGETFIRCAPSR